MWFQSIFLKFKIIFTFHSFADLLSLLYFWIYSIMLISFKHIINNNTEYPETRSRQPIISISFS